MNRPQIVNIINFIRGCEPREPIDLVAPVAKQIELINQYHLPSTFLIQYDAMLNGEMTGLLKSNPNPKTEIGLWLEIVQPLVETVGLSWRSKRGYAWDWFSDVGFTVGYTPEERKLLIDECMRKFHETFGYFPKSVGSWAIDAVSLAYLSEKYDIVASCSCKDQWGTDGYTLWGGFYMGGYYPSKQNMFCPASTPTDKIPVPVFRMLGSDPIYQYDLGLDVDGTADDSQSVTTLEPVYDWCGGSPAWVDWFFAQTYRGFCASHAYAQAGQENSFGWELMADGLTYQMERMKQLSDEGNLTVQTLAESGEWYRANFEVTAPTASFADVDYKGEGRASLWYCCKNYRVNLYREGDHFWIRDVYKFESRYAERYMNDVCSSEQMQFDNLPIIDGNRFSGNGVRAGLYPFINGKPAVCSQFTATDNGSNVEASIGTDDCAFSFYADENGFHFTCKQAFSLRFISNPKAQTPKIRTGGDNLIFEHNGYTYKIIVTTGAVTRKDDIFELFSIGGKISIKFFS